MQKIQTLNQPSLENTFAAEDIEEEFGMPYEEKETPMDMDLEKGEKGGKKRKSKKLKVKRNKGKTKKKSVKKK